MDEGKRCWQKYSLEAVTMACLKNGDEIVELSDCHLV